MQWILTFIPVNSTQETTFLIPNGIETLAYPLGPVSDIELRLKMITLLFTSLQFNDIC